MIHQAKKLVVAALLISSVTLWLAPQTARAASENEVFYVVPELSARFREVVDASVDFVFRRSALRIQPTLLLPEEVQQASVRMNNATVVAIGTAALDSALDIVSEGRIFALLIPYDYAVQRLSTPAATLDVYMIAAEQHPKRVARLTELVLPGRKSIDVFRSEQSRLRIGHLKPAFEERNLQLRKIDIPDSTPVLSVLNNRIEEMDALLAVPDPRGVNRMTARSILRQTHVRKVPVIGYSKEFVKAGALAAIYATPAQHARHVAELMVDAERVPSGVRTLVRPRYFSVSVNENIAESIGLDLPASDEIERILKRGQ